MIVCCVFGIFLQSTYEENFKALLSAILMLLLPMHAFFMGRDDIKSLTSNNLCSEFFCTELDSDPTVLEGPATTHICQALLLTVRDSFLLDADVGET